MYYEETVIDGVLCWRSAPRGEWVPKTAKELTAYLMGLRDLERLREEELEGLIIGG